MTKRLTGMLALAFVAGCGPAVDDEPEPVGHLEYEYGPWAARGVGWEAGEWFREGRRIELFPEENPHLVHQCAMLTQEAYDQLERTIAALDSAVDYELAPGECGWSDSPAHVVHVEGLAYSPFDCDEHCCRDELRWIPNIYFLAANELSDDPFEIDGQRFPVIHADVACD